MTITQKKIRASVISPVGNAETPYVLSFYVARNRNQLDSCSCSLKLKEKPISGVDGKLTIKAGVGSAQHVVFSGYVVATSVRPCMEDPEYIIVDISATDARKFLEGRTFTRRQTAEKDRWASITGVARKALKSSKLKYTRRSEFGSSVFPAAADQSTAEPSTGSSDTMSKMYQMGTTTSNPDEGGKVHFSVEYYDGTQ